LKWKFSIDDGKLILFGLKDTALLAKETEGYTLIVNGLRNWKIILNFPFQNSAKFSFDLGFNGEILIDKATFKQLSTQFPYTKMAYKEGILYCFDNIPVQWEQFSISNCKIYHNSSSDLNLMGSQFINRFNFVLDYSGIDNGVFPPENLYVKPVKNFDLVKSIQLISDFGFSFYNKNKTVIIVHDTTNHN
jgi:hypothetical protein